MEARSKMKEIIHDAITGEIIEKDLPNEIVAEYEAKNAETERLSQEIEAAQAVKAAEKAALLAKLGITEDEAKLLLS